MKLEKKLPPCRENRYSGIAKIWRYV